MTERATIWSRLMRGLRREKPHPIDFGVLFDAAWYRAQSPDIGSADPLAHFLSKGAAEGRNPNPLFDTKWYLTEYPDVAAAGINPLVHFITHGAPENRNPGPSFDTAWYRANSQGASVAENPLARYLATGKTQGRRPVVPDAARRHKAAIKVASNALEQFHAIEPAVREQIEPDAVAHLRSWTGQALGKRYDAWKQLFIALPETVDAVMFVSSLDRSELIEPALKALAAMDKTCAIERMLILSTDAPSRSARPQGELENALLDIDPDLSLQDRADIIATLIYHLRPKIALNVGSAAWWQAVRESGAALSIATKLSAVLSIDDDRTAVEPNGGPTPSCLAHLTSLMFDTPSSRDLFEREVGIPDPLRAGVIVLSQQQRS